MIEKSATRTQAGTGRHGMKVTQVLPGLCLLLGFLLGYLAPLQAAADWTAITETTAEEGTQDTARVTNREGHALNVQRDTNGIVHGMFSLNDGAAPLDHRSCPTIRIDDQRPRALTALDGPCEVQGRTARFTLGIISDGVIKSTLLTQLMNGKRIFVWHHLKGHGYQETEFTLRGSMQALMKVMGKQVRIQPQERPKDADISTGESAL